MREKRVFVKGLVSKLYLNVSSLYQVWNFNGHGIFKIVVFFQLGQFVIRRMTSCTCRIFCLA